VLEFAWMMLRAFNSDLQPLIAQAFRVGDTRHTVSDISRLRTLGWEPTVPVEQNVAEYAEWIGECAEEHQMAKEHLMEAEKQMWEQGIIRKATGQ
jgi:dTDP-L-rhamnose 4-epimerase